MAAVFNCGRRSRFRLLVLIMLLAGCASAPEPEIVSDVKTPPLPVADYQQLDDVTELNADQLKIYIKVGKAGSLANLGHEHAIEVGELQGYAHWPENLANARADIEFQLPDLQVDTAAAMAALGVDNDLDNEQKADTRNNMLKSLDASQFPAVRVQFIEFKKVKSDEGRDWQAKAILWLHGTRRSYPINLSIEPTDPSAPTSGNLTFKQTQFGIQPFSALNGGLQVSDELSVHFRFACLNDDQ